MGGSLFQENLIVHIKHASGKFPEKIKLLLENHEIFQSSNIALIIESSIEKTPATGTWIKNFDTHGLIINCNKLQLVEEKIWLKGKLNFLQDTEANEYVEIISNMNKPSLIYDGWCMLDRNPINKFKEIKYMAPGL